LRDPARWSVLLAAGWLGLLLAVAAIGTASAFALLPAAQAGPVAARMLGLEAGTSLGLGAVLALLQRAEGRRLAESGQGSAFTPGLALALGALFCTVLGYYGVLPLMDEARAGRGRLGFGTLHAVSAAFYGAKVLLVAALAWRLAGARLSRKRSACGGDAAARAA